MSATSRRTIASRSATENIGSFDGLVVTPIDQLVDQVSAAPDDVEMPERDRIECAGIDCDLHFPLNGLFLSRSGRWRAANRPPRHDRDRCSIACVTSIARLLPRALLAEQRHERRLAGVGASLPVALAGRGFVAAMVDQVVGDLESQADVARIAAIGRSRVARQLAP